MLPGKFRKRQILPVNQDLLSVYFLLAKFQLMSCNLSIAMICQMTYTQKLPKLCSATLTYMILVGNQSEKSKQDGVERQIFVANYALISHAYLRNKNWCLYMVQRHALRPFQLIFVKQGLNSLKAAMPQVFISYYKIIVVLYWIVIFVFFLNSKHCCPKYSVAI